MERELDVAHSLIRTTTRSASSSERFARKSNDRSLQRRSSPAHERAGGALTAQPAIATVAGRTIPAPRRPPLFLISLKAGGLGLKLTNADYIFVIGPTTIKRIAEQPDTMVATSSPRLQP